MTAVMFNNVLRGSVGVAHPGVNEDSVIEGDNLENANGCSGLNKPCFSNENCCESIY